MSSMATAKSSAHRYSSGRPWSSITGKLIVLYTLSASTMVVLIAGILYWVLIHNLDRLTEQFLASEVNDFRAILRERPDDQRVIEAEVNYQGVDLQFPGYYARIMDEAGRTLIESHNMSEVMEPAEFPPPGA